MMKWITGFGPDTKKNKIKSLSAMGDFFTPPESIENIFIVNLKIPLSIVQIFSK